MDATSTNLWNSIASTSVAIFGSNIYTMGWIMFFSFAMIFLGLFILTVLRAASGALGGKGRKHY